MLSKKKAKNVFPQNVQNIMQVKQGSKLKDKNTNADFILNLTPASVRNMVQL